MRAIKLGLHGTRNRVGSAFPIAVRQAEISGVKNACDSASMRVVRGHASPRGRGRIKIETFTTIREEWRGCTRVRAERVYLSISDGVDV